ncbi:MAG: hypothetical protein K2X91_04180 [Thermoleophilia bacterium]|nr:hypothetical protein [Thermoleophilia bacterium]
MNVTQGITALQSGLATLKALAPLVGFIPGAGNVAGIAATLAEVGANLLDKIQDGSVVASSTDGETIKALLEEIQGENDALAQRIAAG